MQAITECGLAGWIVVLIAIVAIPIAATALALAINRKRTAAIMAGLALSFGFAPYACGTFGEQWGRSRVDSLLAGGSIAPDHSDTIREVGYAEAAQCRKVGLGGSAIPGAIAIAALALAMLRRDPNAAPIIPPQDPR